LTPFKISQDFIHLVRFEAFLEIFQIKSALDKSEIFDFCPVATAFH